MLLELLVMQRTEVGSCCYYSAFDIGRAGPVRSFDIFVVTNYVLCRLESCPNVLGKQPMLVKTNVHDKNQIP